MESYPVVENKNPNIKHYQKINIFGDIGVGKSSLILHMENFDDDNFQLPQNELRDSKLSSESDNPSFIVEEIKRVKVAINDDNPLYLSLYETNLDDYDGIKMNLDTLLIQTECVILMWDNSKNDSFDNIPNLFYTINQGMNDRKFRKAPIFLIQNKTDLDLKSSQRNEGNNNIKDSIDKMKKENNNLIFREISLLDKDSFLALMLDIYRNMSNKEPNLLNNDVVNIIKFNEKPFKGLNRNHKIIKCILLGHTCVGKTTFFKYFLGDKNRNYLSTIGVEQLIFEFSYNKEKGSIQLYDTSGQEKFRSLSKNYYKEADGIILMYDVTNNESFESLNYWLSDIQENIDLKNISLILVANKIDEKKRVISKKEGIKKAEEYNIKYYESCCLNGLNIFEIFNELIFESYNKKNERLSEGIRGSNIRKNNSVTKSIVKDDKTRKGCCDF